MTTCSECLHLWYLPGGSIEVPYPEFSCTKDHWDGVENTEDLLREIDCEDFKEKQQ